MDLDAFSFMVIVKYCATSVQDCCLQNDEAGQRVNYIIGTAKQTNIKYDIICTSKTCNPSIVTWTLEYHRKYLRRMLSPTCNLSIMFHQYLTHITGQWHAEMCNKTKYNFQKEFLLTVLIFQVGVARFHIRRRDRRMPERSWGWPKCRPPAKAEDLHQFSNGRHVPQGPAKHRNTYN